MTDTEKWQARAYEWLRRSRPINENQVDALASLLAEAAADEREMCAKLIESRLRVNPDPHRWVFKQLAAAIRVRHD